MTQTFSKTRLIDYFAVIDLLIESITEKNDNLTISNMIEYDPIIPKCSHRLVNFFPKKLYKDCYDQTFDSFNHIINNLTSSLPNEELYISRQDTKFFSLFYTDPGGQYYYGHYLRVYEEYKSDHPIQKILPKGNNIDNKEFKGKKIYGPKYICFISSTPFFISFKSILEEIYFLSNENSNELVKVENILNFLLFRVLLPKYEDTQISFTLNNKIYKFNSNILYSELSLKILFQLIPIENIVKLVFAYLMNSWIIFLHSNPIILAILSLVLPFPPSYSIIINVKEKLVDVLECPVYPIVGIYKQGFPNIEAILKKKFLNTKNNKNSFIICDLDKRDISYFNIDIKDSQTKEFEDKLIKKLRESTNIYDSTVIIKKIDVWKEYQSFSMNRDADKSEIISSHPIKTKGANNFISGKRFDEIKIRTVFLDFFASLFEAFDENKHYKNENNNKTFVLDSFINDSKENLKEFLKVFTSTPLWDIFIQNITYIVNSKYKDSLKSHLKIEGASDTKNIDNKTAAILNRCDRMYELFVKAIEKKKLKKSLKSLFKINITHNISLPQISSEHKFYSQTGIFDNPLNEIKFTNFSSISLHKNQLNIPFATLQENPMKNDILNFISKESLSNYSIINSKNLSEDYCKYYRKHYDSFIKFFGFINKLEFMNNNSINPQEELVTSKTVKLQKAIDLKDSYVNLIQKIVGVNITNHQKMIEDTEIISKNKNFKNEFNINIGLNIIQTASLCEFCKVPNSLWEIRKNIRYEKKPDKKSKVVCKNCNKPFVAQFLVIDDPNEDDPLNFKGNFESESFITEKEKSILDFKIDPKDRREKDITSINNIKKIDYMSIEQIYEAINALKISHYEPIDNEIENEINGKHKKDKEVKVYPVNKNVRRFNPSLYYNLLLLFGDIKIISENNGENIETFNIDEYILYLEKKNKSYVNKWKKTTLEKSKSKNKDKKSIKKTGFITKKVTNQKKETDQKKIFKCELKNFMTKHNHDKFIEENMKKLAQLNNSLNRTDLNSIATDYRQTINKTNDNISEMFQTKRSEGFNSMNSFNQLKRVNTGKDKLIIAGNMKYPGDDELRETLNSPFNSAGSIDNNINSFKLPHSQTKKIYENDSQMNSVMRTRTMDLTRGENKSIIPNSNYKDLYYKKQFQNFK